MMLRTAGFILATPFIAAWVWARRHPRLATVLAFLIAFYVIGWIAAPPQASAADGGSSDIDGDDLLSSMGIPASHYHSLFINRGDVWTLGQMFWSKFVDYAWGFHYSVVVTAIDTFVWLLKFEWIDLIATPMSGIAKMISGMLDQLGIAQFALFVSGAVAAALLVFMKLARAILEITLASIICVAAGGVLSNPVAWLTSDDGPIEKAQLYGSQLSAALLSDDGKIGDLKANDEDIIGAAMEAKLVDLFIVDPAEEVSFGHRITGDCKAVLEKAITAVDPVKQDDNSVREAIGSCDTKATDWADNTGPIHYFNAASYSFSSITLIVVSYLIAILLISAIIATLFSALQTTWRGVLAVFPFTNRGKLATSIALTAAGVLFIVTMQLALAGYWAALDKMMGMLAELGTPISEQLRMLTYLEIALVLILIVLLANHRRVAKVLAERNERRMQALKLAGVGIPLAGLPMANELKNYATQKMALRGVGSPAKPAAPATNITFNNLIVGQPDPAKQGPVDGGTYHVTSPNGNGPTGGDPGSAPGKTDAGPGAGTLSGSQKAANLALTAGRYGKALRAGPAGVATQLAMDAGGAVAGAIAGRRVSIDRDGVGHVESATRASNDRGYSSPVLGSASQTPTRNASDVAQSSRPTPPSSGPQLRARYRVVVNPSGVGQIVHETTNLGNPTQQRTPNAIRLTPLRALTR